jgi:hypothetical protein
MDSRLCGGVNSGGALCAAVAGECLGGGSDNGVLRGSGQHGGAQCLRGSRYAWKQERESVSDRNKVCNMIWHAQLSVWVGLDMTDWMARPKSIGTPSHAILKVGVGSPKLDRRLTLLF